LEPGEIVASGESRGAGGQDSVLGELLDLEKKGREALLGSAIADVGELGALGRRFFRAGADLAVA